MPELIMLFKELSAYFDETIKWEDIEEIYNKIAEGPANKPNVEQVNKQKHSKADEKNKSGPDDEQQETARNATTSKDITNLQIVQRALRDDQVLFTLLELCTTIRNLWGDFSGSYDIINSWDEVVKSAPRDGYLTFIYTLAGLSSLDAACANYTKLSLAAVNLYFLSLTIPGAKGFHIFEDDVILHCLQVFNLLERIQNEEVMKRMTENQPIEIWVRFVSFCDDLKLLLRYVHFKDHILPRDALLRKLIKIQYWNHERGYATNYSANMHVMCFEIFEEFINAHNGEPHKTLNTIMKLCLHLHTYLPKPRSSGGSSEVESQHISDFFIQCINKYPKLLVEVLNCYIKFVITNPARMWKPEQTLRCIDYAAKYDAVLFTKCNESCVDFLTDAIYAEEIPIRIRAVELATRILQIESHVDWQMFRHEISSTPREVYIIKELVESLRDINNLVKLRAVQGLYAALLKGSPNARKIVTQGVKYAQYNDTDIHLPREPRVGKNEIRFGKPEPLAPDYTFEGHEVVEEAFLNMPEYIYTHLFISNLPQVRRAGITFMEEIIKVNPLIIYNTNFVEATSSLVNEPTALVRKQTLHMIDAILEAYPNCYPVIWVWCTIVSPMLRDPDLKNVELAMNCFRSRVLVNIKGIDQSNMAEHFMPWVIIRTMLSTQARLYLQICFHLALKERMIDESILSIIESHLVTSNSTEAWIVLNFISGKVKSQEPDNLIHMFTSMDSWNKEQNMLIALEVLANCIKDFSHTALNNAFTHIHSSIRDGKMLPVLIGKAFDFLLHIDNRSKTQSNLTDQNGTRCAEDDWIAKLHDHIESCILDGIADFPDNRATLMSYLYSYSEINLQTRIRPDEQIIAFIHKFMSVSTALRERDFDLENDRLFNSMICISGRFSLRDTCVARKTCVLYGKILNKIDRPPIVNTIIISVTDLCKKHTQIVEDMIPHLMGKLSSMFLVNRRETFKCFEHLVLQDLVKMRGSLLLGLLAVILDEDSDLAGYASNFFEEYLRKNPILFKKCLIECPFMLNEYKNLEGLYNCTEGKVSSPLKGVEKRRHRFALYNHMMGSLDEVYLVAHFGQLKVIKEKSHRDSLITTPEGASLVIDVLYIMRRVCQLVKKSKTDEGQKEIQEGEEAADATDEQMDAAEASTSKQAAQRKGAPLHLGRRIRNMLSMKDALSILEKSLVFIPAIYVNMRAYDSEIERYIEELARALNKRFPQMIQYAQPASFWSKYYISEIDAELSQPAQASAETESNSDGHESSDNVGTDDDDEPLFVQEPKRKRLNSTEMPMECLFNPIL